MGYSVTDQAETAMRQSGETVDGGWHLDLVPQLRIVGVIG